MARKKKRRMPAKTLRKLARRATRQAKLAARPNRRASKRKSKRRTARRATPRRARRPAATVTRTLVRSASVRTVSRRNPRRGRGAILIASRSGTVLRFDGRAFTARGKAKEFPTLLEAYVKGEELLRRHPVLRGFRLYARQA